MATATPARRDLGGPSEAIEAIERATDAPTPAPEAHWEVAGPEDGSPIVFVHGAVMTRA